MLAFRDRLRSSDADRKLYERTKHELAARRWKYAQNYADAKSHVVRDILTRAASAVPALTDGAFCGSPLAAKGLEHRSRGLRIADHGVVAGGEQRNGPAAILCAFPTNRGRAVGGRRAADVMRRQAIAAAVLEPERRDQGGEGMRGQAAGEPGGIAGIGHAEALRCGRRQAPSPPRSLALLSSGRRLDREAAGQTTSRRPP